mgnify:CR=1 FL=1
MEILVEVFKRDIKVRLRPGFFPFVEPGFELDMSCVICGATGCPTCKRSGWVEILGSGMVHPQDLRLVMSQLCATQPAQGRLVEWL